MPARATARRTHYTTDHETIRSWSEEHDCYPAIEMLPHKGPHHFHDPIILGRHERTDETIRECGWDEFFQLFDDKERVFAYEEGENGSVHQVVESEALREMSADDRIEGGSRRRSTRQPRSGSRR